MQQGRSGRAHGAGLPLAAPGADSPADGGRRTGQEGAILMFVLAMVLMLSIAVAAILTMSLNSQVVARKLETSTKSQHRVDGALEEAINLVRNDSTVCSTTSDIPASVDGVSFTVECDPVTSAQPSTRVYNLNVTEQGSSDVVGLAQIKVIDWPSLGYKLEVCDWLLGGSVSAPLNSCTTGPVTP